MTANNEIEASMLNKILKDSNKNMNQSGNFENSHSLEGTAEIDQPIVIGKKPIVCDSLAKKDPSIQLPSTLPSKRNKDGSNRHYMFDVNKLGDFNYLVKARFIKFIDGKKEFSDKEIKGKEFCKWH